jgi:hypothetical protein
MERMTAYKILVGKPEGKRPLGGPGRRCDNIKRILERQNGVAQDRDQWRALVNTVMSLRAP